MKKISIISSVVNGNLKRNRNLIASAIKSFEGKDIEITLQLKRKTRTSPENRYYFGVVVVIFQKSIKDHWGEVWSKEQVHEFLKTRFLFTERYNEDTGEVVKLPKSTTECSTTEFEEYLTECRQFSEEWFNAIIPMPNEDLILEI